MRQDTQLGKEKRNSTIVLLTLNELDGLIQLWDEIPIQQFGCVLAVDGGSTDGTREFLEARDIPILDQPIMGRGVAFRVAAEAAWTERLVFFSPDGNEDPADIVRLDDLLLNGARLAIASRFAVGAQNEEKTLLRPRARVNQLLTGMANLAFNEGEYVTDTINGFRALRTVDLLDLKTTVKRFPIEYQISIRSMLRHWSIMEVPTIESDRAGGESKALSWPVGMDHLKVLFSELPAARWFR